MKSFFRFQQSKKLQYGMTLIEVVIALVLFALIALALVSGMNTMGQTLTKSTQRIDQISDMRIISQFLRRTVSSTQAFFLPAADGHNVDFYGESNSLLFVGNMSGYQGPGGLHLIRIYTQPSDISGQQRLFMQFIPWQPGAGWAPNFAQSKPELLINGVTLFKLHYLAPEGGDAWQSQWTRLDQYPAAVRIQIAVHDRFWPEMVIWLGGTKNGPQ
jgi:general secretion pathway protein J